MWNQTKEINEAAQMANFTDFPLIICGKGPKRTKSMQTQARRIALQNFLRGIQGIPSESWRPEDAENVVLFEI